MHLRDSKTVAVDHEIIGFSTIASLSCRQTKAKLEERDQELEAARTASRELIAN